MTDHDDMRAFVRDLFGRRDDAPPRDIVDRTEPGGLTLDDLKRMNEATGTWSETYVPGRVLLDTDGLPTAVEPGETVPSCFGGVCISTNDLARLGLTRDELERDYPNVMVMTSPNRKDAR